MKNEQFINCTLIRVRTSWQASDPPPRAILSLRIHDFPKMSSSLSFLSLVQPVNYEFALQVQFVRILLE